MREIIVSSVILLLLDVTFIGINSKMFSSQVMDVQLSSLKINIIGGILAYIFLLLGLNYFIIREHRSILDAFILGLIIYGVYEATTYTIFKKWRIQTVLMDTLWGGILFATTTYLTYLILNIKNTPK